MADTTDTKSEITTPPRQPRRTNYRERVAEEQITPTSPRTPTARTYSSAYSSPSAGLRPDDETFVFEFSTRHLKAGIAGASSPRCILDFSPSKRQKLGDYSQWLPGARQARSDRKSVKFEDWGNDHVLWHIDIRKTNLGLLSDLIERTVREAISKYILILDGKRRKFTLALPPASSDPLLETTLLTLFNTHPAPTTITLLPCPVLCVIAAGLRSALVVDIGWDETVVSVIYEFRQVLSKTTIRGMKRLSWAIKELLDEKLHESNPNQEAEAAVTIEEVDEVLARMAWCRTNKDDQRYADKVVHIPVAGTEVPVDFQQFSDVVEDVFLDASTAKTDADDKPLPLLMFQALLALPIDMRQVCLSRITVTGDGCNIPGLRGRLLAELAHILSVRTWDPIHNYGHANIDAKRNIVQRPKPSDYSVAERRNIDDENVTPNPKVHKKGLHDEAIHGTDIPNCTFCQSITSAIHELSLHENLEHTNKDIDSWSTTPSGLQPHLSDTSILNAMRSRTDIAAAAAKAMPEASFTPSHERIRGVLTAGAWAGASLLAGLNIPGAVEIERERFLRSGLEGYEAHLRDEKDREAEMVKAGTSRTRRTASGLRSFTSVASRELG